MIQADEPWFRKRPPERGSGYDIANWRGAAVLGAFVLMISVPPIVTLTASRSLLLAFVIAMACAIGGAWWQCG